MANCASAHDELIRELEDLASSVDMAESVQHLIIEKLDGSSHAPTENVIKALHAVSDRIGAAHEALDEIVARELQKE